MSLSLILLHMAGATVLLLFAVQFVRTGVERAHGDVLRSALKHARRGRLAAAAGGAVMAVVLQSSTAVAVITCGIARNGLLPTATGIALLLGADLGSAIVVRLLSFDLAWLIPVCLALGGLAYLRSVSEKARESGRTVLGIGFVLLSLQLIGMATEPLREGALIPQVANYLAADFVTAFLAGAIFTWIIHSSVASILMVAAFTAQGLISLDAAVPLVFGANLGGGLIAFWLSRGMPPEASRLPMANFLFKVAGALAGLVIIEWLRLPVEALGARPAVALVNLHMAFNLLLALLSLPFVKPMARLVTRLIPEPLPARDGEDPLLGGISALDRSVVGIPGLALANAVRELLRMSELVDLMVRSAMDMLRGGTAAEFRRMRAIEAQVNEALRAIKLYLAEVNREAMSPEQARLSIDLTDFAINLEHAGGIVAKNLLTIAEERAARNLRFSQQGWSELVELHQCLLENMHLAFNVFVSRDLASARLLVIEKEKMRARMRETCDRHLTRLQEGVPESVQTSRMHLETARGFKEINSLLATIAYPILSRSGELLGSRLVMGKNAMDQKDLKGSFADSMHTVAR